MISTVDMTQSVVSSLVLQNGHGDDDEPDDSEPEDIYLRDRRRAKSLPAYPEQADLFSRLSERCRKRVKFADALGLSLASVRHFSIAEDPQVPSKVFAALRPRPALHQAEAPQSAELRVAPEVAEARALRRRVALESASLSGWCVRGLVRAGAAVDAEVEIEVGVRYTFNRWASFSDAAAAPVPGESASGGRRFAFAVHVPPFLEPDARVHFAVYMRTERGEFWDNNDEQNYCVECGGML
ncbi:protein phosphatase 1 regulatory subunit 3G [Silurus meridionalis]|uniref:protein phosphatase 1 regulatory subunit 3G n=1 Tax=Silurus meridionalis TaxID=175797 RepID=UPI001EEAFFD3|nr:protein phosphatase 1 regulatory subunit 3G [Silurus meridionalis]XP_046702263.1 protein phosphatase 1 regulatory subunit 3G [Silurus meridionalis]